MAGKRINRAAAICLDFVNILQFSIERYWASSRFRADEKHILRRN
ncbi:MAG: hypothetical protein WCC32_19665 [Terriglobales bacterium]